MGFGRKGWLSVSLVLGAQRRYSCLLIILFLSFFSTFISCVMYIETLWHYSRLIGFVVCAFYIPPIFLWIPRWLSLHYTDAFAPHHFVSFLWVFSPFLVSSPGASWLGRRRSRRLTSVILRVQTSGLKLAFYNRLRNFTSHSTIEVVSLVFGRRDQCCRRACRQLAGSGNALQVKVGKEELETTS